MLLSIKVGVVMPHTLSCSLSMFLVGREASTGRKVAIKKIKVGQFKDGLDMSAVREVKYLRELHHPNVIEVRVFFACKTNVAATPRHSMPFSLFSSSWTCFPQRRI